MSSKSKINELKKHTCKKESIADKTLKGKLNVHESTRNKIVMKQQIAKRKSMDKCNITESNSPHVLGTKSFKNRRKSSISTNVVFSESINLLDSKSKCTNNVEGQLSSISNCKVTVNGEVGTNNNLGTNSSMSKSLNCNITKTPTVHKSNFKKKKYFKRLQKTVLKLHNPSDLDLNNCFENVLIKHGNRLDSKKTDISILLQDDETSPANSTELQQQHKGIITKKISSSNVEGLKLSCTRTESEKCNSSVTKMSATTKFNLNQCSVKQSSDIAFNERMLSEGLAMAGSLEHTGSLTFSDLEIDSEVVSSGEEIPAPQSCVEQQRNDATISNEIIDKERKIQDLIKEISSVVESDPSSNNKIHFNALLKAEVLELSHFASMNFLTAASETLASVDKNMPGKTDHVSSPCIVEVHALDEILLYEDATVLRSHIAADKNKNLAKKCVTNNFLNVPGVAALCEETVPMSMSHMEVDSDIENSAEITSTTIASTSNQTHVNVQKAIHDVNKSMKVGLKRKQKKCIWTYKKQSRKKRKVSYSSNEIEDQTEKKFSLEGKIIPSNLVLLDTDKSLTTTTYEIEHNTVQKILNTCPNLSSSLEDIADSDILKVKFPNVYTDFSNALELEPLLQSDLIIASNLKTSASNDYTKPMPSGSWNHCKNQPQESIARIVNQPNPTFNCNGTPAKLFVQLKKLSVGDLKEYNCLSFQRTNDLENSRNDFIIIKNKKNASITDISDKSHTQMLKINCGTNNIKENKFAKNDAAGIVPNRNSASKKKHKRKLSNEKTNDTFGSGTESSEVASPVQAIHENLKKSENIKRAVNKHSLEDCEYAETPQSKKIFLSSNKELLAKNKIISSDKELIENSTSNDKPIIVKISNNVINCKKVKELHLIDSKSRKLDQNKLLTSEKSLKSPKNLVQNKGKTCIINKSTAVIDKNDRTLKNYCIPKVRNQAKTPEMLKEISNKVSISSKKSLVPLSSKKVENEKNSSDVLTITKDKLKQKTSEKDNSEIVLENISTKNFSAKETTNINSKKVPVKNSLEKEPASEEQPIETSFIKNMAETTKVNMMMETNSEKQAAEFTSEKLAVDGIPNTKKTETISEQHLTEVISKSEAEFEVITSYPETFSTNPKINTPFPQNSAVSTLLNTPVPQNKAVSTLLNTPIPQNKAVLNLANNSPGLNILSEILGGSNEKLDYDDDALDTELYNETPSVNDDVDDSSNDDENLPKNKAQVNSPLFDVAGGNDLNVPDSLCSTANGFWKVLTPRRDDNYNHKVPTINKGERDRLLMSIEKAKEALSTTVKSSMPVSSKSLPKNNSKLTRKSSRPSIMDSDSDEDNDQDHSFKRCDKTELLPIRNANEQKQSIGYCDNFRRTGECKYKNCKLTHTAPCDQNLDKVLNLQVKASEKAPNLLSMVRYHCREGTLDKAFQLATESISSESLLIKRNIVKELIEASAKFTKDANLDFLSRILSLITEYELHNSEMCSKFIITCSIESKLTLHHIVDMFRLCVTLKICVSAAAMMELVKIFDSEGVDLSLRIELLEYVHLHKKQSISIQFLNFVLDSCIHHSKPNHIHRLTQLLSTTDLVLINQNILQRFIGIIHPGNSTAQAVNLLKAYNRNRFGSVIPDNLVSKDSLLKLILDGCWGSVAKVFKGAEQSNDYATIHNIHQALIHPLEELHVNYRKFAAAVYDNGTPFVRQKHFLCLIGVALMLEVHKLQRMVDAYQILVLLHNYNMNYYELLQLSYDLNKSLKTFSLDQVMFPCTVVFVALEICIKVKKYASAANIFIDCDFVKPSDNFNEDMKKVFFVHRARFLLILARDLHGIRLFENGLQLLEVLLDSLHNDLDTEEVTQFITGLNEVYDKYIAVLLNENKLDKAMDLYSCSKKHKLEYRLAVDPLVMRAIVVSHADAGLKDEAWNFFKQFVLRGIYRITMPESYQKQYYLHLETSWTKCEIGFAIDYYLDMLFQKHLENTYVEKFSLQINFMESEGDVSTLKCLREALYAGSAKESALTILAAEMQPELELDDSLDPLDAAIRIKPKSLYERYCFWKRDKLSFITLHDTPYDSLSDNAFRHSGTDDPFSFGVLHDGNSNQSDDYGYTTAAKSPSPSSLENLENKFVCRKLHPENPDYTLHLCSSSRGSIVDSGVSPESSIDWQQTGGHTIKPSGAEECLITGSPEKPTYLLAMSPLGDRRVSRESQSHCSVPPFFPNGNVVANTPGLYPGNHHISMSRSSPSIHSPVPLIDSTVQAFIPEAQSPTRYIRDNSVANSPKLPKLSSLPHQCSAEVQHLSSSLQLDMMLKTPPRHDLAFSHRKRYLENNSTNFHQSASKKSSVMLSSSGGSMPTKQDRPLPEFITTPTSQRKPLNRLHSSTPSNRTSSNQSKETICESPSPDQSCDSLFTFNQLKNFDCKTSCSDPVPKSPESCDENMEISQILQNCPDEMTPANSPEGAEDSSEELSDEVFILPKSLTSKLKNVFVQIYEEEDQNGHVVSKYRVCATPTETIPPNNLESIKTEFKPLRRLRRDMLRPVTPLSTAILQSRKLLKRSKTPVKAPLKLQKTPSRTPKKTAGITFVKKGMKTRGLTPKMLKSGPKKATKVKENFCISLKSDTSIRTITGASSTKKNVVNAPSRNENSQPSEISAEVIENYAPKTLGMKQQTNKLVNLSRLSKAIPSKSDVKALEQTSYVATVCKDISKFINDSAVAASSSRRKILRRLHRKGPEVTNFVPVAVKLPKTTESTLVGQVHNLPARTGRNFNSGTCTEEVFNKIQNYLQMKIIDKIKNLETAETEATRLAHIFILNNEVSTKLDSKAMKLLVSFANAYMESLH